MPNVVRCSAAANTKARLLSRSLVHSGWAIRDVKPDPSLLAAQLSEVMKVYGTRVENPFKKQSVSHYPRVPGCSRHDDSTCPHPRQKEVAELTPMSIRPD